MSVLCCVLSGRGLCVGLITRPEESYRLWCVSECDREASIMRRPWPTGGCCALWGGGGRNRIVHFVALSVSNYLRLSYFVFLGGGGGVCQ
jgi:hypothetical protein